MQEQGLEKTLLSEEEIAEIVKRLGSEITEHYKNSDKELIIIGLL